MQDIYTGMLIESDRKWGERMEDMQQMDCWGASAVGYIIVIGFNSLHQSVKMCFFYQIQVTLEEWSFSLVFSCSLLDPQQNLSCQQWFLDCWIPDSTNIWNFQCKINACFICVNTRKCIWIAKQVRNVLNWSPESPPAQALWFLATPLLLLSQTVLLLDFDMKLKTYIWCYYTAWGTIY